MTLFWIIAAALTLLALVFVVVPLLRPAPEHDGPDQDTLNIEVYRQRLAELDADLAAGALEQDRYDAARKDLERELLYDLGDAAKRANPLTEAVPAPTGRSKKGKRKGKPGKTAPEPLAKRPPDRSPILAVLLAVALPLAAVATYLQLGNARIIPLLAAAQDVRHDMAAGSQELPPMDVLAEQLAGKMAQNPDNLEGWLMLGRTYFAINQLRKALGAMERAYKLAPSQPVVLVSYAEALAANAGNRLAGRPAELIRAALKIDPTYPSARWLDGMRAYQEAAFAEAAATWQAILDEMDPAGEEAEDLREMIAEASSRVRGQAPAPSSPAPNVAASEPSPPASEPATADREQQPAASGAVIEVSVSLDPSLADEVSPGDSLFVYARATAGPPMPLAAQRLRASDLPAEVTLDDSMATMPAMRLSAFPEVTVGARISATGQAMPQSGDLEGSVEPVSTAEPAAVSVVIDHVRP